MSDRSDYVHNHLRKDIISGLIVGIVAIPLGMAFAIASGVKPEYGIYTTIIAGILISIFGGSRFQIGGPTGAFVPILLGIVTLYGYKNLLVAGFMAGLILVLMGLLKLGSLIRYIPRPVTIGFTAGIAVTIFTGQIGNFLGLTGVSRHEHFLPTMADLFRHLHTINGYSVLTAALCLVCLLLLPKLTTKVPPSIVGLILSTLVATFFYEGQVATIGSAYGSIPAKLPDLQFPDLTWETMRQMIGPALVIALLGAIESLLSAVVADGMAGTRHDSNRELVGQGIANLVVPLFGGIPATGAIARTATNIRSGAASRMSGVIHGVVVLAVLLVLAPFASRIPLAAMAPILMIVAWNMSERKEVIRGLKARTGDSIVLAATFLLTVFTDLTTAVEIGLGVSVVLFIKQMRDSLTVTPSLPEQAGQDRKMRRLPEGDDRKCPHVHILTVEGPLFFGTADALEDQFRKARGDNSEYLLLRMNRMTVLDSTGAAKLSSLIRMSQAAGRKVILAGLRSQPEEVLRRTGHGAIVEQEHRFSDTAHALRYVFQHTGSHACQTCSLALFEECPCRQTEKRDGERASSTAERKLPLAGIGG
ncbi:SulP family inorganic anion transporter [Gorillibacterium timonense]|uniref:SulP family inorganic anion transporter n=1 Tax=Gorillibacterium timonense TaxID=1689269 RepID=UPI00071E49FA|nr:sulfate permease [Gorillibacterium timonense]